MPAAALRPRAGVQFDGFIDKINDGSDQIFQKLFYRVQTSASNSLEKGEKKCYLCDKAFKVNSKASMIRFYWPSR